VQPTLPGVARIKKLAAVTHVLIRLKSDIPVTKAGDFLPDGSYMADIHGGGQTTRMRVIEYHVEVAGQDVPEMFCLVTDLDDWQAYPAGLLAAAYKWRWDGSETALREAKSAIRSAGPSTGPIFRSATPDMVGQVVHPREISFTAARRAAIATTRAGTATASLPAALATALHDAVLRDLGRRRVTVDRDRHRDHKTKARQAFPAAGRGITTRTAPARILVCGPLAA